ncbi:MAG TPA: hypothetical protein VMU95_01580 [Trebonia sp.]|nr:hypothetical protein [Trebonia sp.]
MDETAVRSLLASVAETPEPLSSRIDIDAACRVGRARQARRALVSAVTGLAAAVAVGLVVAVPHALSLAPQQARPAAAAQPSARHEAPSSTAPATFSPLVPYAGFGSLPSGFSEQSTPVLKGGTSASLTTVVRMASQLTTGRQLVLTVSSAKACQGVTVHLGKVPSSTLAAACAFSGYGVTGKAPAINGRPAYWVNYDALAWQYAPGGWAVLAPQSSTAQSGTAQSGEVQAVSEKGWMTLSLPDAGQPDASSQKLKKAIAASPQTAVKEGLVVPPSASTLTLLAKVAGQVRFGQKQPLVFPFRYSGGLPRGSRVASATFYASGRTLIGTSISVSPAAGAPALWIAASAPESSGCTFQPGDSVVEELGMPWVKQVERNGSSGTQESLCSPVAGGLTAGLSVSVSADTASFSADAVLARLSFLGTSPSGWTASPFP